MSQQTIVSKSVATNDVVRTNIRMLDKEKVEISYSDGTTYEGHVNEQLEKQGSGITVYTKECREGDMYGVYKVYKGSFKHDKELRES